MTKIALRLLLLTGLLGVTFSFRPVFHSSARVAAPALRMNQIQVIGSHNSYKQAIEPPLMKMLLARDSARFSSLDYQHVPLGQQLDLGLRKLEIDVVFDPKGGRYANPLGLQLVKGQGGTPAPFDPQGVVKCTI